MAAALPECAWTSMRTANAESLRLLCGESAIARFKSLFFEPSPRSSPAALQAWLQVRRETKAKCQLTSWLPLSVAGDARKAQRQ
jgi:hypothetical protein